MCGELDRLDVAQATRRADARGLTRRPDLHGDFAHQGVVDPTIEVPPAVVLEASTGVLDPDVRVIAQLGARAAVQHAPIGPEVARRRSPRQRRCQRSGDLVGSG